MSVAATHPAHVVVATIVERDGKFLFVEERIGAGLVINQPAGHWEPGETLVEGALRETLEESGWVVEVTALLGVYDYKPAELDYGFLRVAFLARPRAHDAARGLDAGIERALWLTRDELADGSRALRSPMVLRCVDDALAGRQFPLALIAQLHD